MNQRIKKAIFVTAITAVATGVAACGDDDTDEAAIERYCDAVSAAEQRGEELFADLDQDDEEARLAAELAMLDFVRSRFPAGNELPSEIRDDFEAFLAGMERNVEPDSDPTDQQQAAEKRPSTGTGALLIGVTPHRDALAPSRQPVTGVPVALSTP